MKIGISGHPTCGGGTVAAEIGLELARRGHEARFIAYSNPVRLAVSAPGSHCHEVGVSDYPLFQYPPYSLALASRIDAIASRVHRLPFRPIQRDP